MATPRKRFFTVECSLYREPWPRNVKTTLVMLGMHMTDRWASDCLTAKQATVAHLSVGDLLTITGAETRAEAHAVLREVAAHVTIKVTPLENGFTKIEWRKLAETQWKQSRYKGSVQGRTRDKVSPRIALSDSDPDPDPHPQESEKRERDAAAAAPPPAPKRPKSVKAPETPAPFMLDLEQQAALRTWCAEKYPESLPRLGALVEACLDHHLALGNRRADWLATCRTWIRNEQRFARAVHTPADRQDARAELLARNAAAAIRLSEEREQRERERRASGGADANVRRLRAGSEPIAH